MNVVRYHSNNSGGDWWLNDDHWKALEAAGWKVEWIKDIPYFQGETRWLGALARDAVRVGLSLEDAIREWEKIVGMSASDPGCACCGEPHSFLERGGDALDALDAELIAALRTTKSLLSEPLGSNDE